jgi:hypothetical protein
MYPIEKPDSGAAREYAFEIVLDARVGTLCGADGFVQDAQGEGLFGRPALPDPAVLKLTFSGRTAQGCDSVWAPMEFRKE